MCGTFRQTFVLLKPVVKGVTKLSSLGLGDILTERLVRKGSELSMTLEYLQLSLRVLRDLLNRLPESDNGDNGVSLDDSRESSRAQLESFSREVSCRVEKKEEQLLRVWRCLDSWKSVLKGTDQDSDNHSSGYHAWSISLQGEPARVTHLSSSIVSEGGGGCFDGADLDEPHKPLGEPKKIGNLKNTLIKEEISAISPTPSPQLPGLADLVDQDQSSQLKFTSLPVPSSPLLPKPSLVRSLSSCMGIGSETGKISTVPGKDMQHMHDIQRKMLMAELHKGFGVFGETLMVGQDYPGHNVVFEEGDPAEFWVHFDTNARKKLQERIQVYLIGAEPALPEEVREGGLVLAR